jgi:glutamyl-Q tRNA(Asp) synthetase
LRIEDIDHTRCKTDYTLGIYEDLHWLGFDWPLPVRIQSKHIADYLNVIESLRARGLLYECFKTRKELMDTEPKPIPEYELLPLLHAGEPFALRLSIKACQYELLGKSLEYIDTGVEKTVDLSQLSDIVVGRKDLHTSYHIAVTHDDMLQGITHVVRGADLADQTPYHVLLQHLMGWPSPIYHHHALLTREDGEKLSKRGLDTSIASLRENGLTAAQVLAMASP